MGSNTPSFARNCRLLELYTDFALCGFWFWVENIVYNETVWRQWHFKKASSSEMVHSGDIRTATARTFTESIDTVECVDQKEGPDQTPQVYRMI